MHYSGEMENVYTNFVANLSRELRAKFHRNRLSFVEDITKNVGIFFSGHRVEATWPYSFTPSHYSVSVQPSDLLLS